MILRTYFDNVMTWNKSLSLGLLIEHFPPESHTIKNLDDSWALLATSDGLRRFEEAVRYLIKVKTRI